MSGTVRQIDYCSWLELEPELQLEPGQDLHLPLLPPRHAWRYNAARRLALLLTEHGAGARAVPLWQGVLCAAADVFPSPRWPEWGPLLRGLAAAQRDAGVSCEKALEQLKMVAGPDF